MFDDTLGSDLVWPAIRAVAEGNQDMSTRPGLFSVADIEPRTAPQAFDVFHDQGHRPSSIAMLDGLDVSPADLYRVNIIE